MEKIEELLEKAEKLFKEGSIKELTDLLKERQLKAANNARLFELKGIALRRLAFFPKYRNKSYIFHSKSIKFFTKAIQLEEENPALYRDRGKSHSSLHNFDLALKDLNTAIKIDPNNIESYVARAVTYTSMKNFKDAKKDYAKAIKLEPKNPNPYLQRRYLWRVLKSKTNEVKDLTMAIKLHKEVSMFDYRNLGDYYFEKAKYDLAFEQYNALLDLYPLSLRWVRGGGLPNFRLVNIYNAIGSINKSKKINIYMDCIPICESVEEILDKTDRQFFSGSVVHFTKLSVADILLSSDESKFRYYHVSYMNDPEEGKILMDFINDPIIRKSFSSGELTEENNFYIGSFLPETHEDELVMWRTYGKDEHEDEAKGCSIIIDRAFFEEKVDKSHLNKETQDGKQKSDKKKQPNKTRSSDDFRLRKVIYYNKIKNKILGEDGDEIRKDLKKLKVRLKDFIQKHRKSDTKKENKAVNQAVDRIIYYLLTELRYLFKSSDYAYENEERVIRYVRSTSDLVKIDETGPLPKKLYVEARNPIRKHIKKIVLGPKVAHPDRWLYLKVKAIKGEKKLELVKSNCKFQ